MLKRLRALAALSILGGSLALGGSTATALDDPTGATSNLVDVSSSIQSLPAKVSPPGETAVFAATITNKGIVATDATLTVDLVAGAQYVDHLSSSTCGASGGDAVCTVSALAPGQTVKFDVVANTATTIGNQVTTAIARSSGLIEPLEYQNNNTSTTTTEVVPVSTNHRAGLVEEGESMELTLADGRKYVLTVPKGVPGVIVRELAPRSGFGKQCGTYACRNGFILDFVPHAYFKAENPYNPLLTNRTFGPQGPCQGLGNEACASIYYGKSDAQTLLTPMLDCPGTSGGEAGSGVAIPSPCINQRYKVDGLIWFDVRLLSNDPVELPPVLLG